MLFSTLFFTYVFLPLLLLFYWLPAKSKPSLQLWVLTVFSLFFYAFGEPVYVFLMIALVGVNYLFGILCAGDGMSEP